MEASARQRRVVLQSTGIAHRLQQAAKSFPAERTCKRQSFPAAESCKRQSFPAAESCYKTPKTCAMPLMNLMRPRLPYLPSRSILARGLRVNSQAPVRLQLISIDRKSSAGIHNLCDWTGQTNAPFVTIPALAKLFLRALPNCICSVPTCELPCTDFVAASSCSFCRSQKS